MNFKRFVCWRPENIEPVMDTEALQVADAPFLATHHPLAMIRRSWVDAEDATRYTEDQFLKDFLKPRDYVFVPVLGEAGTGKSHLVRWLSLNIPESDKRHVILIRKVGTNLRDIVRQILQRFTGPEFDDYRRQLRESTEGLNVEQAAHKLLDNLAFEVGPNRTGGIQTLTEKQQYFVESLPALLYDPFFRERFLAPGGLLRRLAQHVLGRVEKVERLQEPRRFAPTDLPINLLDWMKAGEKARSVYSELLGSEELRKEATDWLNLNLDAATASLLELRGGRLSTLLLEIRKQLAARGTELVLLIEDFARLQGIESQVLEALLVRPHQGNLGELCVLRTALACTTGIFREQLETVRQRTNFIISLDKLTEPSGQTGKDVDLPTFAARYLNAIRVSEKDLKKWNESVRRTENPDTHPPPNCCDSCQFRDKCHKGFGESLGIGLYPFTATALQRMNSRKNPGPFNPRKFILWVVRHTLENYGSDITNGEFPSSALNQYFGRKLDPIIQTKLQLLGSRNASRYEALLDLWTDGNAAVSLDPVIHQAFDLPSLSGAPPVTPVPPKPSAPTPVTPPHPGAAASQKDIDAIHNWANGSVKLPQDLVNKLRQGLHKAVQQRIDWDSERLLREYFTTGLWFVPGSINFQNQVPQARLRAFRLTVPEKASKEAMRDAGLALVGMLRFEENKTWDFQDGAQYLRHFMRLLDQCATRVVSSIRHPVAEESEWDPVPGTVQVLALIARVAGLIQDGTELGTLLSKQDGAVHPQRTRRWRNLIEALSKYRSDLIELLVAYTACTKGSSDAQYVDASQLAGPLRNLRAKDWEITAPMLETRDSRFETLRRAYGRLRDHLDAAIEEERDAWLKWYQETTEEIGASSDFPQLANEVRAARDRALRVGMLPHVYRQIEFDAAVAEFEKASITEALEAVQELSKCKDRSRVLELLTQNYVPVMTTVRQFREVVEPTLNGAKKRLEAEIAMFSRGSETNIAHMESEIVDALSSIEKDFRKLAGEK